MLEIQKPQLTKIIAKFGWCQFCHKKFDAGIEICWDKQNKKAYHIDCPPIAQPWPEKTSQKIEKHVAEPEKTYRKSIQDVKTKTDHIESHLLVDVINLFDGKFSIPCKLSSGEETYLTVSISTAKQHHKFPGSRIIKIHFGRHDHKSFILAAYITTKNELQYYKSFNTETELSDEKKHIVKAAIMMLLKGEENASYALEYARICKKCWHCGKDLFNLNTLQKIDEWKGMGHYCFTKYGDLADRITDQVINSKPKILSM